LLFILEVLGGVKDEIIIILLVFEIVTSLQVGVECYFRVDSEMALYDRHLGPHFELRVNLFSLMLEALHQGILHLDYGAQEHGESEMKHV
jgi:hypothetical protein